MIWTDREKAFDKIQNYDRTLSKLKTKGEFPQLGEEYLQQLTLYLMVKIFWFFPLGFRTRQGCLLSIVFFNIVVEGLAHVIR